MGDLPRLRGRIKAEPADFEVEEIPAYEPCGEGEHLFLWIEKEGVSADTLVRHVARALGIASSEVGCAGLKDTRAVTRQYVSVPARVEGLVGRIETAEIRVLRAVRHGNKLKTGHLRGNRFRVVVREVDDSPRDGADREGEAPAEPHSAVERPDSARQEPRPPIAVQRIAARLRATGVANFYGPQRFGSAGETVRIGLGLLRGERLEELVGVAPHRRKFLRRLALSSVQSALFNEYLAQRMRDGLLHRVLEGEVLLVCASGGPFVVDNVTREQQRFEAREVVPAGPIFGPKMRPCRGESREREERVLAAAGLSLDDFRGHGKLVTGTRRANVVWIDDLEVVPHGDGALEFRFALPRGSYATVVLNEFVEAEGATAIDEADDPGD